MTARFEARPACSQTYALGEGPLWDRDRNRLLWVDIEGGLVCAGRLDRRTDAIRVMETWHFDDLACAVAVSRDGELLVATRHNLIHVRGDGSRDVVAQLVHEQGSRLNDGAVDPQGRFLAGSMALDDRTGQERLLRWDGRETTVLDDDLTLSNGLAWSPSGDRLYSIDSIPGVVWVRDYPGGARHELFRVTDGLPDGLCVDTDGNLWIAVHERGEVRCLTPRGELLATVAVPAPKTTSCAFAGPNLDVLVVTAAEGPLFTVRVGAVGLHTPYWHH
ncbi:calcium-binding protein [Paractinoplanes deccanensis]|uniref:Calcium-binding protein n=1 Tax=Paractinoplanes deccanensis TaxID=113561 RepID=A0ABQ3YH97_9ACTN|nr:SMP-30/gluconolactonase/LRE family protein [Actinoplanes deccanensis]GID79386.1 calcium-binding protein [Actinoplanes deccanensis]